MKRLLIVAWVGIFLLSACGAGEAIEAHNPWARPALQGNTTAVYLLLHNHSAQDDELVSVSSNVSDSVEIHESMPMEGTDAMQMNAVASVPLPADGEVEFKPGGLHIMLVDLKQDLKVGDQIEVTLHFKSGFELKLTVPVLEGMDDM